MISKDAQTKLESHSAKPLDPPGLIHGQLALRFKYITEGQLRQALSFQKQEIQGGRDIQLGAVLFMNGMIDQEQLDFLLSLELMKKTRALDHVFAQFAVAQGYTEQSHIDEAFQEQKTLFSQTKCVRSIADILISRGVLSKDTTQEIRSKLNRTKDEPSQKSGTLSKKEDVPKQKEEPPTPAEAEIENLLQPEPAPEPASKIPEFQITISNDKLEAYLCPKCDDAAGPVPLKIIRELIEKKEIKYGLLGEHEIETYLRSRTIPKEPWKIAQGKASLPGMDEEVEYFFDTDPLKIGTVKEGGSIDFKDRGATPQVKSGAVLMKKKPAIPGVPGIDVYGKQIPSPKPKTINLRSGKGTEKSEDGKKVLAKIDGRPTLDADGVVHVFPEISIPGDIGLETGHVEFDGHIDVKGSVLDGFHVKGGGLVTKEVLKTDIDITGDIVVLGGVIGANIKVGGNLKALFIRASTIQAAGDIVVEKEILDSHIETSGACYVVRGKILSSRISAKNGMEALQIGSDLSKPCELILGVDERIKRQIELLTKKMAAKKEELEKETVPLEKLEHEADGLNSQILRMAQEQENVRRNQSSLDELKQRLQNQEDTANLAKAEGVAAKLQQKLDSIQEFVDKKMESQNQISAAIDEIKERIGGYEKEIEELKDQIDDLTQASESQRTHPAIKVPGVFFAGTVVKGNNSKIKTNKDQQHVIIREIQVTDPEEETVTWQMTVSDIS